MAKKETTTLSVSTVEFYSSSRMHCLSKQKSRYTGSGRVRGSCILNTIGNCIFFPLTGVQPHSLSRLACVWNGKGFTGPRRKSHCCEGNGVTVQAVRFLECSRSPCGLGREGPKHLHLGGENTCDTFKAEHSSCFSQHFESLANCRPL